MRISSGAAKGVRLEVPKGIRPTSEKVRQAVLTSLGSAIEGARVLDLYCGSGAWGLEALSRGAVSAVLVDRDSASVAACRANVEAAGMSDRAKVVRRDVEGYLEREAPSDGPFAVAFADPPYREGRPSSDVLSALEPVLAPGGVVIWEGRHEGDDWGPPEGWLVDERRYGDTQVTRLRRTPT